MKLWVTTTLVSFLTLYSLSLYIYIYSLNGNINIKIYHRKVENKPTYQIHRFPYEMQYSSCLRINSTVASLIQRHQQQWVLIKFQNCINLANKNAKKNILEKNLEDSNALRNFKNQSENSFLLALLAAKAHPINRNPGNFYLNLFNMGFLKLL